MDSEKTLALPRASKEVLKVYAKSNALFLQEPKSGEKCPDCGEKLSSKSIEDWIFGKLLYYECSCGYRFAKLDT